jgi:hypothetical protein
VDNKIYLHVLADEVRFGLSADNDAEQLFWSYMRIFGDETWQLKIMIIGKAKQAGDTQHLDKH